MNPTKIVALFLALAIFPAVPPRAAGDSALTKNPDTAALPPGNSGGGTMTQGREAFLRGDFGAAATAIEGALKAYEKDANAAGQCDALIMLSQVRHFTGQYRMALEILEKALAIARERRDKPKIAAALGAIGNAQIGLGNGALALRYLRDGLAVAAECGSEDVAAAIHNNLGNLHGARHSAAEALESYRESARLAEKTGNVPLEVSAIVNGATAALRNGKYGESDALAARASSLIPGTGDSYLKAHSLIGVGLVASGLRAGLPDRSEVMTQRAVASFKDALAVAEKIRNPRTASYAYGYLGNLYEGEGRLQEGLELTRRAALAAQAGSAPEALYRWHWQSARLLARMNDVDNAIVAYRHAIGDLQVLRQELSSCYADPESSYQQTASAVCSGMVDLLLRRAGSLRNGESAEPYLIEAREVLEALKVFELREYFKDDCIDASRIVETKLDAVSGKTAVFYPILLPDRVELLVSVGGRLKAVTLSVGVGPFTKEIREYRRKLVKRTTWEFLPHAQKLYDWLIRPVENDLAEVSADTLVFVPDGPLRTVPMASLHDGKRFLVDRFRIAVTPGLNLTDPRPVKRERARMLSMGLTRAVQGFPGLPYVSDELRSVKDLYGGEQLVNDQFRLENLEAALKRQPFTMVHVASHGQFGGNTDETFLLAFDERFTIDRFGEYVGLFRFREEPLDLLTLSACETATGDDRAALGLAGVAVRAGARSALATLWHVNDPATYELIVEFYRQLRDPSVSRAAALQAAQRKLQNDQRYDHPAYWAPFLLINNWL